MQKSNISANFPDEVITQLKDLFSQINTLIDPYAIALSADDIRGMVKLSDKTEAFMIKVMEYSESNSEFNPTYLDTGEMATDFRAYQILKPIYEMAQQVEERIKYIRIASGNESLEAGLMYYNNVKAASKRGIGGSKPIFDDLSMRYTGRRGPNTPE